jgi:hypothetical protein
MANRILLSATGLKVSAAGQNVLTATGNNLLFDNSYAGMGLYVRGSRSISTGTETIALGKNFSRTPFIAMSGEGFVAAGLGETGFKSGASTWILTYDDANTRLVLAHNSTAVGPAARPYTLYYAVWDWD